MSKKRLLAAQILNFKKEYKESDFKERVLKAGKDIFTSEEKQKILKRFLKVKQSTTYVIFDVVNEISFEKHWFDRAKNEELLVLTIQTNIEKFPIMLEYLGKDPFTERHIYQLHSFVMTKTQTEHLKEVIFEDFKAKNSIILLHEHTTFEKECNQLVKKTRV